MTAAALVVTVTIVCYCPCIKIICLHTDSRAGSVKGQTATVSAEPVLVVTVIIVYHYPCINIIYLHTDSNAGSAEGQTGTGSLWWVWLLIVTAAVLIPAFIIGIFIKKKKR